MSIDRRRQLETLPGWVWDTYEADWENGFGHLQAYVESEGNCRVPTNYKTEGGYPLGGWATRQRQTKDTMPDERRKRLEALPGWVWSVR